MSICVLSSFSLFLVLPRFFSLAQVIGNRPNLAERWVLSGPSKAECRTTSCLQGAHSKHYHEESYSGRNMGKAVSFVLQYPPLSHILGSTWAPSPEKTGVQLSCCWFLIIAHDFKCSAVPFRAVSALLLCLDASLLLGAKFGYLQSTVDRLLEPPLFPSLEICCASVCYGSAADSRYFVTVFSLLRSLLWERTCPEIIMWPNT